MGDEDEPDGLLDQAPERPRPRRRTYLSRVIWRMVWILVAALLLVAWLTLHR